MTLLSHPTLRQFLRFGAIGTAGVFVDSAVLYLAMHGLGLDPYSGRAVSWMVTVTFTWAMNRRFTFADTRPAFMQWLAFVAANAVGGIVNYGVYAALIATTPMVAETPFLGVAAGSLVGLAFNFTASKWLVFRRERQAAPPP